jgi:hypothetical protein
MKQFIIIVAIFFFVFAGYRSGSAQDEDVTIVAPTSEAAEGLDLQAVSELFKDSKNMEEFEKALNDPETGINNLDLDENGEVDFIRVVEEAADETRVIILQVPLGKDEFQDVATIEVEKTGDEEYNMQIHGNEDIYGADYYVAPTVVHIHTWPVIVWLYAPVYHPYRSVYYWGYYPRWWRPYHPVTVNVYRTRTVRYRGHTTFRVTKTSRVRTVSRVKYKPHSSTLVRKKTTKTTIRKGGRRTTIKRSKTVKKKR